jgi:hypothetical protein
LTSEAGPSIVFFQPFYLVFQIKQRRRLPIPLLFYPSPLFHSAPLDPTCVSCIFLHFAVSTVITFGFFIALCLSSQSLTCTRGRNSAGLYRFDGTDTCIHT